MPLDPVSLGIMGGTSLLSGLMGRSAAKSSAASQSRIAAAMERAQRLQEEMVQKYEGIAEPFREELYPQLLSILSGETDMEETPFYGNMRRPLEEQYGVARRNIEARGGGTGRLASTLANLESRRAEEVGGIPGRLYQSLFSTGMGLASGKPEMGVQAYGDIARTSGPLLDMYQTGINQGNEMMGQSGMLLGDTLYNAFMRPQQGMYAGSQFGVRDVSGSANLPTPRY